MKQHTESLISYVMEWSGKSRSESIEWLDRSLPRLKGDEDEAADRDGKNRNSQDCQGDHLASWHGGVAEVERWIRSCRKGESGCGQALKPAWHSPVVYQVQHYANTARHGMNSSSPWLKLFAKERARERRRKKRDGNQLQANEPQKQEKSMLTKQQ